MKRLFPLLAVLLLAALTTQSCHKPPISSGHKNFRQSKRNRQR